MLATSTVVIENNNKKIWHRDKVINEIILAIHKKADKIIVHLNNEGPCAESLGLYSLLDSICQNFNYDPKNISIVTCNLLEKNDNYNIVINPPIKHIDVLQKRLIKEPAGYKTVDNNTKHFGHFIGHGNVHRLHVGSILYKKYHNKTVQTYHCNIKDSYHREFLAIEDIMFGNYSQDEIDCAVEFLRTTPIKFDLDIVDSYPIRDYKMYGISLAYPSIFVDIVAHTFYSGNTFYLDEKLWRPIITKTPFIVQGSQNFMHNLKKLGFQTFDRWWSEGYSEDHEDHQPREILSIIEDLSKLSVTDLSTMYKEMKPVLDHNYNTFLKLNSASFEVFK